MVQPVRTNLILFLILIGAGFALLAPTRAVADIFYFEEALKEVPRPILQNRVNDSTHAPVFNSKGALAEPVVRESEVTPPVQGNPSEEYIQTKKMAQSWANKLRSIQRR